MLGDVGGTAMSLWPACVAQAPGGSQLAPLDLGVDKEKLRIMPIMELTGWRGFRYSWLSPVHLQDLGVDRALVAAMPNHPPEGIVAACARAAFGALPLPFLRNLASHLQLALPGGASLFDTVWSLMRWALPNESEDNLWRYM